MLGRQALHEWMMLDRIKDIVAHSGTPAHRWSRGGFYASRANHAEPPLACDERPARMRGTDILSARSALPETVVKVLMFFLARCFVLGVSWPIALLALVFAPIVWLLSLPLRLLGYGPSQ
jgi:hypothetical protein